MCTIKCFTSAGWYSYMERHVTERHIYSKKAASKPDIGIVYTRGKKLVSYQTVYTRADVSQAQHDIYLRCFPWPLLQSPEINLCVNDTSLCIHLAFVVTTSSTLTWNVTEQYLISKHVNKIQSFKNMIVGFLFNTKLYSLEILQSLLVTHFP